MADSSGCSTVALTPESFTKDVTNLDLSDVFALLRPLDGPATEAFAATVNAVIKNSSTYNHHRQFLRLHDRAHRAHSTFTEDEEDGDAGAHRPPLSLTDEELRLGSFKLRLQAPPSRPAQGWYLGTARGQSSVEDIDILLAPPTDKWTHMKIAAKHARLFIHSNSCRIVLEARHSIIIASNGVKTLRQSTQVLEHGELFKIGQCLYSFEYTPFFNTSEFATDLAKYMRQHHQPRWQPHACFTPGSVGEPRMLGGFYYSPHGIAQGSFGRVTAGWASDGSAVAIKFFKEPTEQTFKKHVRLMERIGNHVRPT